MGARKKTFWCLGNDQLDSVRSCCTLGMLCGRQQLVEEKKASESLLRKPHLPSLFQSPSHCPLQREPWPVERVSFLIWGSAYTSIYTHTFKKCLASLVLFLYLSDIILFTWKHFHFSCGSIALSLPAA